MRQGADGFGALLITARADARRVHDRQAGSRAGLGLRADARARRRLAGAAGGLPRPRGHRPHAAGAAADLPLAQRLGRERDPGAAWSPACSACSSWGRCTCGEVLGYDALEIGLAFLPTTLVMGTLSLRYSERLIMRFGPRNVLIPGLALIAAGLRTVRARAGRRPLPDRRAARRAADGLSASACRSPR